MGAVLWLIICQDKDYSYDQENYKKNKDLLKIPVSLWVCKQINKQ